MKKVEAKDYFQTEEGVSDLLCSISYVMDQYLETLSKEIEKRGVKLIGLREFADEKMNLSYTSKMHDDELFHKREGRLKG